MSAIARHNLHTQEGKNRFKSETDQLPLVDLTPEESAQIALYRKLNYFPTPPWAVRALIKQLQLRGIFGHLFGDGGFVLEPCAGRGHMAETLREYGMAVSASDIHDHGKGYDIRDFLTFDFQNRIFDAVFMNPPFSSDDDKAREPTIADRFIAKALMLSTDVFVFGRLAFLTPSIRYTLMSEHLEAQYVFVERVPIALGRISNKSGATDYAWYHFKRHKQAPKGSHRMHLIPPGTRDRLTRHGDDRK